MSDRGQAKPRSSKLGRWIALGVLALAVIAAAGYAYVARTSTANIQSGMFDGAVSVYAYNFTPYDIAYSMTPGLRWFADANDASGKSVQSSGYKPASADAPMDISWRYASGPQATEEGNYPFQVKLPQPKRPAGDVVLELRLYPEGKVAARYANVPLVSDFSNVDPDLPGGDWVSNR